MKENGINSFPLQDLLKITAPGTILREGLDSILKAESGALIVIGNGIGVMEIAEGGFEVSSPLTPAALYELAKMDGAIILSRDTSYIFRANVHLTPPHHIFTRETGIRHRIAERCARFTRCPVIAISQERGVITLFQNKEKFVIPELGVALVKANQALQTATTYRQILERTLGSLNVLEFHNMVTLKDVARAFLRLEMLRRVAGEAELYMCQLGTEVRLLQMQLEEILRGVEEEEILLLKDYFNKAEDASQGLDRVLASVSRQPLEKITDHSLLLDLLGYEKEPDSFLVPRGYRALHKIPLLPQHVIEKLVARFGNLRGIISVVEEKDVLKSVPGVGDKRARNIKNGLEKMSQQAILNNLDLVL